MKSFVAKCLLLIWLGVGFTKSQNNTNHKGPCIPGEQNGVQTTKRANTFESITGNRIPCVNNMSNEYPCSNVVLESFVSLKDLTSSVSATGNDIWGWTSSDKREFAIMGTSFGTTFVEITDPENPIILGELATHNFENRWRDIKTYKDHAYIVAEADQHGMQIFDLTQLLTASPNSTFSETFHYGEIGSAHNLFINEDSGFAYIVGSKTCAGGLHIVDITEPVNPRRTGCYSNRGYTHDVQCVNYDGPDTRYTDKEICFASNTDKVDIIDVTRKWFPQLISTFIYDNYSYTHQGWLTEDKKFFLIDDETDNFNDSGLNTRTIICDVSDLRNPTLKSFYLSDTLNLDHNQYVKKNFVYQANYRAGLRILNLDEIENGELEEVAYFDTYPPDNDNHDSGAWSNYPYFESDVVVISDANRGLFVVRPTLDGQPTPSPSKSSMPSLHVPSSIPSITAVPSISPSFLPTTTPTEVPPQFFVSDIDVIYGETFFGQWWEQVEVVVVLSKEDGSPITSLYIEANYKELEDDSLGARRFCTADADRCTFYFTNVCQNMMFEITDAVLLNGINDYNQTLNSDVDGDSDGTSIIIEAPETMNFWRSFAKKLN